MDHTIFYKMGFYKLPSVKIKRIIIKISNALFFFYFGVDRFWSINECIYSMNICTYSYGEWEHCGAHIS